MCYTALRDDRRLGLIYGPYSDGTRNEKGELRFIDSHEFAGLNGSCTYCNGPLPRGRAKNILKALEMIREKGQHRRAEKENPE